MNNRPLDFIPFYFIGPDGTDGALDDPILIEELESFEYEYTRTGVRYSAPQGCHDDTVCALALAWKKHDDKLSHITFMKPKITNFGSRNNY